MATQWYYRAYGQDLGPLSFRELAQMVRDGSITETDLVRADWESEWHCAAGVVGLFHTAQRLADETSAACPEAGPDETFAGARTSLEATEWSADGSELPDATVDDLDALLNGVVPSGDRPSWMRRLVEVASLRRRPITAQSRSRQDEGPAWAPSRLSKAIHSALAAMDVRAARKEPGRFARWRASLDGQGLLHSGFRWGTSILLGNGVAWCILNWSDLESRRLPVRTLVDQRLFPIWGPCDSMEYSLLLVNTMLVAGVAGYFVARGLERLTDD
jgi:hypothetical protein